MVRFDESPAKSGFSVVGIVITTLNIVVLGLTVWIASSFVGGDDGDSPPSHPELEEMGRVSAIVYTENTAKVEAEVATRIAAHQITNKKQLQSYARSATEEARLNAFSDLNKFYNSLPDDFSGKESEIAGYYEAIAAGRRSVIKE